MRQTLVSFIQGLSRYSRKTAYINRTQYRRFQWTFGEILDHAKRFGVWLDRKGVRKGDKVILWGENCPEWVIVFLGCVLKGVVVVPVDDVSTEEFARKIRKIVQAKVAIVSEGKQLTLPAIEKRGNFEDRKADESVNVAGDLDKNAGARADASGLTLVFFADLERELSGIDSSAFAPASVAPQDIVEIVFTSGTTAEPKGVLISHRNIISNIAPIEHWLKKYACWFFALVSFRFLSLLPLSHMFGQALAVFIPMMLGKTVVLIGSLNPAYIRKVIREERIWVLVTVPRILDSLREMAIKDYEKKSGESFQRSFESAKGKRWLRRAWIFRKVQKGFGWRFRCIVVGGAALGRDLEEFWARLGTAVVQGYGLTETAPIISINNPLSGRKGSIGKAVGDQQIRLGEDGEILVRGSNVTEGYFTAKGIERAASEEGWFRTGDLGEMDDEGFIYFKGRKKDVIVTAEGMNVYPDDVEAVLNRIEGVKESAVVSAEREGREAVHAVLLLKEPGRDPSPMISRANEILHPHQRIRSFSIWPQDDFPRTSTFKVKRREVASHIRASIGGREAEARTAVETEAAQAGEAITAGVEGAASRAAGETVGKAAAGGEPLVDMIRELSGKKDFIPGEGTRLSTDIGLGSIDRVELLCAMEDKYQISIDEKEFIKCETMDDLKKLVRESKPGRGEIKPPRWQTWLPVRGMRVVGQQVFFLPITRYYCSITLEGKENLRGLKLPFIIVSNHLSYMDASAILAALPLKLRAKVIPVMMQEIFNDYLFPEGVPFYRRFLAGLAYLIATGFYNAFPFPTESDFRNSMEYAGEMVGKGYCPLIFPEGGRSLTGKVEKFKPGVGMMTTAMKIPVLPIRIDGFREVMPLDKKWPKRGKVSIRIGKLMTFEAAPSESISYESIASRLESIIKSL